jgi:hypothetical protein
MPMTPAANDTTTATSFDLVLPPDPDLLRVVRLVASGLASLTALGIDAVEGIRVAADELVSTLIQASDGGPVTVTFELGGAALVIRGRTQLADGEFALDPLTDRILDAVVSSHTWSTDSGVVEGRVEQTLAG